MKYKVRFSFIGYYETEIEAKNFASAKNIAIEKYEKTELPEGFEIGDTNDEVSITNEKGKEKFLNY